MLKDKREVGIGKRDFVILVVSAEWVDCVGGLSLSLVLLLLTFREREPTGRTGVVG